MIPNKALYPSISPEVNQGIFLPMIAFNTPVDESKM
ncbi:Uncharacterised protein [Mycoplasmoides gallisepticum]|uniref:Uncharacterized protein n=1 Tax=Mycoplasmoides gallisepticum TaxID=2096 RepID=A0A3B0P9Y9_MYCGL|nr:Uncharacterised protein [Mycoplasmoides gallisepticum]